LMGAAAAKHSDYCIITSDNPRSEEPGKVIGDILPGMADARYEIISDRKMAIVKAIEMSRARDIVLIAGKGHETYQEVNGKKTFFDDRDEARKAIQIFAKAREKKREQLRREREERRKQGDGEDGFED